MLQSILMEVSVKNRLREIRVHKKMTQQQIADHLSVDRTTYTQYEMGKRNPSIEIISKLSELYGCTTDYLLGRTDEPEYELRTDLPEALKKIGIEAVEMLADSDLTPDEIQTLIAFAREWKAKKESSKNQ